MDSLAIRDLEPDDVEAVAAIAVAAWEPIYRHFRQTLGDELFAAAHPDWRTEKARQVRAACDPQSPAMVYVAAESGKVVGFVTFYASSRGLVGEIGNNAVHPDYQGRGIALALYERAFERLRSLGMRGVRVGTGLDPAHAPARRAYEKAGFTIGLPSVEYYRLL